MLISHRYCFIFIKPLKAAGTSVECLMQTLCDDSSAAISEYTKEKISAAGIVGYRGPDRGGSNYWHHMPATEIKRLHPYIFRDYTKISIVRNPYQKAISLFLWLGPLTYYQALELAETNPAELQNLFLLFLRNHVNLQPLLTDAPRLLIDGVLAVDYILRYEELTTDLSNLFAKMKLPLSVNQLGRYKHSGVCRNGHVLSQYLCTESLEILNTMFNWYLAMFGYARLESIADL